jgi:hypothetical protein
MQARKRERERARRDRERLQGLLIKIFMDTRECEVCPGPYKITSSSIVVQISRILQPIYPAQKERAKKGEIE